MAALSPISQHAGMGIIVSDSEATLSRNQTVAAGKKGPGLMKGRAEAAMGRRRSFALTGHDRSFTLARCVPRTGR